MLSCSSSNTSNGWLTPHQMQYFKLITLLLMCFLAISAQASPFGHDNYSASPSFSAPNNDNSHYANGSANRPNELTQTRLQGKSSQAFASSVMCFEQDINQALADLDHQCCSATTCSVLPYFVYIPASLSQSFHTLSYSIVWPSAPSSSRFKPPTFA